MRDYPALLIAWPVAPVPHAVDLLLAAIDDTAPLGVEDVARGVRVFFRDARARDRAAAIVAAAVPDATCSPVEVPDEDWAARSQAALPAVEVGTVRISPPWAALGADAARAAGVTEVVINPAMGFGTGHHASTRLCLRLLQRVDLAGRRVLDAGTGSGVLALAAWRMGAADVTGIDRDPDALDSARENAGLNAAGEAVRLELGDLAGLERRAADEPGYDVVLANLTGAVLVRRAATLARLAAPDGVLILGGVLDDEETDVRRAYETAGWHVGDRLTEDEWVGLLVRAATIPTATTATPARR